MTTAPSLPDLRVRLVAEQDLTTADHQQIRRLLLAAFPQDDTFATSSSWGAQPEYRLWLATDDGCLLAHLAFGRRLIGVGSAELLIAGVGEVATDPVWQGRGLGRQLMQALPGILRAEVPVAFGLVQCRAAVVPFYARSGWQRIDQIATFLDPDTEVWTTYRGPTLVLPAQAALEDWPRTGQIDLRGMPW